MPGACEAPQEKPSQWDAYAPQWRVTPADCIWRKPAHSNEDTVQPKGKKTLKIYKENAQNKTYKKSAHKLNVFLCVKIVSPPYPTISTGMEVKKGKKAFNI